MTKASIPPTEPAPRPHRFWPGAGWLLAAVACIAGAAWLRFSLIEPLAVAAHCAAQPEAWPCPVRAAIVTLVRFERLGWIALAVVVLGLLLRVGKLRRAGAVLVCAGFLIGSAALMLYSVEPGAMAALLATLLLLRPDALWRRASNG